MPQKNENEIESYIKRGTWTQIWLFFCSSIDSCIDVLMSSFRRNLKQIKSPSTNFAYCIAFLHSKQSWWPGWFYLLSIADFWERYHSRGKLIRRHRSAALTFCVLGLISAKCSGKNNIACFNSLAFHRRGIAWEWSSYMGSVFCCARRLFWGSNLGFALGYRGWYFRNDICCVPDSYEMYAGNAWWGYVCVAWDALSKTSWRCSSVVQMYGIFS